MNWVGRLVHRRRMEEQLEKELVFHVEQHAQDLVARGYRPEEARRLASLEIGGPEQVKEYCRDARGTRWLEDIAQDFRYAFRALRQKPGFAAVALATLALGIGAATVMFTVVNGVLLKPLRYPEPERLVRLYGQSAAWNVALYGKQNLAYLDFLDCRRESRTAEMAGWLYNWGIITAPGSPEHAIHVEISSNLFSVLGTPLFLGRAFRDDEDRPGGAPVAIISYNLWQHRFGANQAVLGAPLVLDGTTYRIVAVTPARFQFDDEADVYTPIGQNTTPLLKSRRPHPTGVIARLRAGATLAQIQNELSLIGSRLAVQYSATNKDRSFVAEPLRPDVADVRSTLWLLLGAVCLVLLISCVNVASLLLARAVSRERELAMRFALGAGRWRLARQCLTESAVLGLGGGALGVALAALGIRPFIVFWPGTLPRAEEVGIDLRVLLFALGVSLLSGVLFGLAPALRVPSGGLEQSLRAAARSLTGASRRLHGALVTCEIALAVVLLVSAGMLVSTLLRLSALDPGVNIHNVLTARTGLSQATLADQARTRAAWQDLIENASRVPGVEAVCTVDTVPMRSGNNPIGYSTNSAPLPADQQPITLASSVTPDYLKVMRIPLRRGRFFDDQDRLGKEGVAVIDEIMAQEAFGGQDPVGKHLWIGLGSDPVRVVGVVGHVRYWGLAGDDQARVRAQLYYPFAQVPDRLLPRWSELMSIAVRTKVPPLTVVDALRRAVRGHNNDQVIYQVRTLEQLASSSLDQQRFLMLLFGIFAGLSLLLASIGIYGVVAYLTGQRVPEIGVRMALGATARDVINLVFRQTLAMVFTGVAVGLAAAIAAVRLLTRLVQGMRSAGADTFAVMTFVLVVAALCASLLPAVRASRIDPIKALRQD